MWQKAEQQARDQAGDVRRVVDELHRESDHDVDGDPEDELPDQVFRPWLMSILRRSADGENERAEDAEDRAAGTYCRAVLVERAGDRRTDSADEIDQRKTS